MPRLLAGDDYDGWVRLLAKAERRQRARRHLMGSGPAAVPALRRGLVHQDAMVRRFSAVILDHLLDDDAVPDLVAALDDDDPSVCGRALHALACDACKQNECRPADDLFVPRAFELLRTHPNPDVRASAIDALGKVGERSPDVARALAEAAEREPHPGLRTLAHRRAGRGLRPARPRPF